ncbi:MAG: cell division protein ZapA [Acidobacteriota bacterium]|nr:cell division protein ZapA [Acidobacteriota bacterium]MDT7781214.1 cell division protein ZapA [Acidobacteriota bacterium]
MSTDSGSVRVNIFNQTYSLRSASGDGEQVQRLARLVDERMRLIASGLAVHDVAKVAVLTALNFADELEGLRNFYETELREILSRAQEEEEESPDASASEEAQGAFEEPSEAEPVQDEGVRDEGVRDERVRDDQSWFDSIFDSGTPGKSGDERLSSQVTSRLRSQVASRLRRLRPSSPGNSITEGEGEA